MFHQNINSGHTLLETISETAISDKSLLNLIGLWKIMGWLCTLNFKRSKSALPEFLSYSKNGLQYMGTFKIHKCEENV